MIRDVAEGLRTFLVPQLEQLAIIERSVPRGALGSFDAEWETGAFWALDVSEHLRERRLERARELLETTDLKVAEVSRSVGYAHPGTLAEAFNRAYGLTPSQWRARAVRLDFP